MRTVVIRNNTDQVQQWIKEFTAYEEYTIPANNPALIVTYAHYNPLLVAIANGDASVGNGDEFFDLVADQLDHLYGNKTTVSFDEEYTCSVEKALKIAPTKLEGSSTILCSHDFCDRTTWYSQSTNVTGEALDTILGYEYDSDNSYWIDLEHGKVPYEDRIVSSYKPHIYVDDVEVTSGFSINYSTGRVTFESCKLGHTVKADYHYENGSAWIIQPDSGKLLKLLGTEVKFTKDATLPSGQQVIFQIYVGNTPYGSSTVYKSIKDFIKCSYGTYNVIPDFGGLGKDIITIPFEYITSKEARASQNVNIRISLKNDEPLTGTWACMVAYCLSMDE